MTNVTVHPSTLEGIKRLAKTIKREQGIPHTKALDAAARLANYENYRHAQKQIEAGVNDAAASTGHYDIYISAYWRDKAKKSGRETLRIRLPKPLSQIVRPNHLYGSFAHFRIDADDHLETSDDIRDQETARNLVNKASLTLHFMTTTGLTNKGGSRGESMRDRARGMPKQDHAASWMDAVTQVEVLTDEPYTHNATGLLAERALWLEKQGLFISTTSWCGMYSPGHAPLFLISDDKAYLDTITKRLDALKYSAPEGSWQGESGPFTPPFMSPSRLASGKKKKNRPAPIIGGVVRNGALPFQMTPWTPPMWRPAERMAFEKHREVAALLKGLIVMSPAPERAMRNITNVRCQLDEWVQREFTKEEMPDDAFFGLYYEKGAESLPVGTNPLEALNRVKVVLASGYKDCPPLRMILKRLSTVDKWLKKT